MAVSSLDGKVIDTHAHVYPAKYLDFLEQIGVDPDSTAIARDMNASDEDEQMAARLRMMGQAGVDVQVLSATPQLPQVDKADEADEAARMVNDIYAGLIRKYPGRFLAYGAIPFLHPQKAVQQIGYCMDELGFVGIAINSLLPDPQMAITDEQFAPIFAELDRRHAPLYIHPTGMSAHCAPMANQGLAWVNGAPVEDAIAALHLLKADYVRKYPNIRFHIAHLGGDLPFLAQRLQDNFEDWGSFPASPAQSLRKMWFDAANFFAPSLELAAKVYDPQKLLAGSDCPYFQEKKYTRAFSYIKESGLSKALREQILSKNACELYRH